MDYETFHNVSLFDLSINLSISYLYCIEGLGALHTFIDGSQDFDALCHDDLVQVVFDMATSSRRLRSS
jgi:hypothetical protein